MRWPTTMVPRGSCHGLIFHIRSGSIPADAHGPGLQSMMSTRTRRTDCERGKSLKNASVRSVRSVRSSSIELRGEFFNFSQTLEISESISTTWEARHTVRRRRPPTWKGFKGSLSRRLSELEQTATTKQTRRTVCRGRKRTCNRRIGRLNDPSVERTAAVCAEDCANLAGNRRRGKAIGIAAVNKTNTH